MFGIPNKITDPSVYILHDMLEQQLHHTEELLVQCPLEDNEKINLLKAKIDIYKKELSAFDEEITKQREVTFQFSIEEIYFMYGQYDNRFVEIEFHKNSDSAKKYGRIIGGGLIYHFSERKALYEAIHATEIIRTNGLIKFDVGPEYELSDELRQEICNTGFLSGDIFQVTSVNLPLPTPYKQEGIKEIPNQHIIEFDPGNTDFHKLELNLLLRDLSDRHSLIENELDKICGYSIFYDPASIDSDLVRSRAFDSEGILKKEVRFYELKAKIYNTKPSFEVLEEFDSILHARKLERMEIIRSELVQSTHKSLETFSVEYPEIFKQLEIDSVTFEDQVLLRYGCITSIFWDFKGYLHIYLRHCSELNIEGHFSNKTKFQYTQSDIKRVLKIILENIVVKINGSISAGKDIRIYGEKSLYYNGNYYNLRIEKSGRVDSFYPLDIS